MAEELTDTIKRNAEGPAEAHGDAGKSTVYYIDIRAIDRFEDFYANVWKDPTVNFIKSKVAKIAEDIRLQVGSSTESITVTSESPLVSAMTASAGEVITAGEVANLPMNGNTPLALARNALGLGAQAKAASALMATPTCVAS